MSKDNNIFIKQMNSVGKTGDCIILHFIMSDDSVFSCWLDKFHFNVQKSVGVLGNGNLDFQSKDFTLEFWLKINSIQSGENPLVLKG